MLFEQSRHCRTLGSELYAELLAQASQDCASGGVTWEVLRPIATGDWGAAVALRFMAAVHRLVLEGAAPQLAEHYPSAGGSAGLHGAWEPFVATLDAHRERVSQLAALGCQTNEVGRCRALIVGFLTVAGRIGLPLRLLEIGASGGLNLRWDHYRYSDDTRTRTWGPADSPVQLAGQWDVRPELLSVHANVAERRGCDPSPIDVRDEEGRLRLLSSLWADQVDRFARTRAAFEVAHRVPAAVDEARAGTWVAEQLRTPAEGVVTVVFHSVVWQYLPDEDRSAMTSAIEAAGKEATPEAPIAWLSMEPDYPGRIRAFALRLRTWPGPGIEEELATSGAHGYPVVQA